MATVDIEISAGDVKVTAFPAISADTQIIEGPVRLNGFSVREASGDIPLSNEGSVTSPAALQTIVTLTGILAGTYTVNWTVELQGTLAAGDANNFELKDTAGNVVQSVNLAVAGEYPQPPVPVILTAGSSITVEALGIGTVGAIYSASITLTPAIVDDVVAEIVDGNQLLACIGLGIGNADTEFFGGTGLKVMNSVTIHMISGVLKGVVYCSWPD